MGYDPNWGCYPYMAKGIGENSEVDQSHVIDLKTEVIVGGNTYITNRFKRNYTTHFQRHNLWPTPYQVVCNDDSNADCPTYNYGDEVGEWEGNIQEDFTSVTNKVLYMDLRKDLVVMSNKEDHITFSKNSKDPVGHILAVDDLAGRFFSYTARDVVGMKVNWLHNVKESMEMHSSNASAEEVIYDETTSETRELRVYVTDSTGFISVRNYGYAWGTYGVVDESKPHEYPDFVPLYHIPQGRALSSGKELPYEFSAIWNVVGSELLAYRIDYLFWVILYVDPSRIDPKFLILRETILFLGSCMFDTKDNFFASMVTGKEYPAVFNKLAIAGGASTNPAFIIGIGGTAPIFFPIAPI
jgi:hypothetical protein